MKKITFPLLSGALALSAVLLSGCGDTGSGQGRAADNGNTSTPPGAMDSDLSGSVGSGGTSTDPRASNGMKGIDHSNSSPDVGSDASGVSSAGGSTPPINTTPGMVTAPGDKGSPTTNSDGAGGAGKGKTGVNPGEGKKGSQ